MAVDTENKRRSAFNLNPFTVVPEQDGTVSAVDRQQAAGVYSGIAAAAPGYINTECRRRSAFNILPITVMPVADGSIAAADRIHAASYYCGITVEGAPVGNPWWYYHMISRG